MRLARERVHRGITVCMRPPSSHPSGASRNRETGKKWGLARCGRRWGAPQPWLQSLLRRKKAEPDRPRGRHCEIPLELNHVAADGAAQLAATGQAIHFVRPGIQRLSRLSGEPYCFQSVPRPPVPLRDRCREVYSHRIRRGGCRHALAGIAGWGLVGVLMHDYRDPARMKSSGATISAARFSLPFTVRPDRVAVADVRQRQPASARQALNRVWTAGRQGVVAAGMRPKR